MSHDVRITACAARDLARLPERTAAACVRFVFGPLADAPTEAGDGLRGEFEGLRSARRGSYRVVYAVRKNDVVVHAIRAAHRAGAQG
ncbi:type II toxin-antitoxin system RelE family toxin [Saccharopolyspora rosea]|uniref:Type II toxin-antitoxin system RelE/ParE family toxin n=1 Tax=Saccharopolyspora rosea TaxID=524884 RepID=A0ABW3FJI2_9PSEU|nr:type II toxin-antitoxin system RelE/ParE family toxin [Saccharopolyspora rosea]